VVGSVCGVGSPVVGSVTVSPWFAAPCWTTACRFFFGDADTGDDDDTVGVVVALELRAALLMVADETAVSVRGFPAGC
jgi:hypothetical protein